MNGLKPFLMPETELPNFAPVALTPERVVETAMSVVGLPYDERATFVDWVNGKPRGYCNCWGLLLVVCERMGLIGPEFWRALQMQVARRGIAQTLRRLLSREMCRVAQSCAAPGDVLLFRWRGDSREWETEEAAIEGAFHHIGFLTACEPLPLGSMVHAAETAADLSGRVLHSPVAAHDWSQVHSVWRFPQLAAAQGARMEAKNDG